MFQTWKNWLKGTIGASQGMQQDLVAMDRELARLTQTVLQLEVAIAEAEQRAK